MKVGDTVEWQGARMVGQRGKQAIRAEVVSLDPLTVSIPGHGNYRPTEASVLVVVE